MGRSSDTAVYGPGLTWGRGRLGTRTGKECLEKTQRKKKLAFLYICVCVCFPTVP